MQGQRSIFDPFSETVDLNQGSASNINGTNESEDWNTVLSPMERRLLNNDLSSELNFSCVNTSGYRSSRSFSSWDVGESSSRANTQDQVYNDGLKVEQNPSSSFGTRDSRLEERQLESSNIHSNDGFTDGHLAVGPLNMQSSGSTHIPLNVSLNVGFEGSSSVDGGHGVGFTNLYTSGSPETEVTALSAGIGTSSAGGSDSSSGSWGPSCKRKALEGTSGQTFTSGSSSFFPQENIVRPPAPVCYNGISISPPLVSPLSMNRQEQLNTRNGNGLRGVASNNAFPPSSLPGVPESESTQRNFGTRESIPPNISSNTNPTPRSNISSSQQSSRRITLTEFLEQRSRVPVTTSANSSNPSYLPPPPSMHAPGIPRNLLPFPSGGNITSGSGSSSSSAGFPGSTLRNNVQHHNFVPSNERRNLVQDPTSWSLATGSTSTNGGGASSSSRTAAGSGSGSRSRSSTALWLSHHNPTTQSHQRLSEFPPWNLFPTAEPESGGQVAHFPSFPSGSSASEDTLIPTRINRQGPRHRSHSRSALLMGAPDTNWRALAADIEGRQRLVSEMRQVLNAIRRGENLRPEDYVLFDPFIHGFAELHDRHRDMRLDVDNMSYEELLALEERIGNVNTGLSEEVILKSMKQRKHLTFMAISPPNLEPCCICQEQYDTGDDIGTLDCGHDFHADCVKKWLAHKNVCPICKTTGLSA